MIITCQHGHECYEVDRDLKKDMVPHGNWFTPLNDMPEMIDGNDWPKCHCGGYVFYPCTFSSVGVFVNGEPLKSD